MLDFYLNVLNITENDMYIFMIILFTWIIPVTILLRIIPNAFEKSFLYCKILYFSFIVLFFLVSFIFSVL